MISYGDKFFHPNFICALLNDLFSIQSRLGYSCAPEYGEFLLLKKKLIILNYLKNLLLEVINF